MSSTFVDSRIYYKLYLKQCGEYLEGAQIFVELSDFPC